MSIRAILVPIFGNDLDVRCLAAAGAVAGRLDAHLTALYGDPHAGDSRSVASGWENTLFFSEAMIKTVRDGALRRREWAERNYARWQQSVMPESVGAHGPPMPSSELVVAPGDPATCIKSYAVVSDLVVASLAEPNTADRSMLLSVLFDLQRPVLALPPGPAAAIVAPPVAIAWNYSAQAARALGAAMPIIEAVGEAVVLQAGHHQDEEAAQKVVAYLGRHGVRAQAQKLGQSGRPAELIAARVRDLGARLLVMGAYSHTRAREFVFGGVTRYMLEKAPVPLLLAR